MADERWFTSDTHFGHTFILTAGRGRPFATTEEMDDFLVYEWNSHVRPTDHIYHLGDFSFLNREGTLATLKRLHGNIHFIRGNHDKQMTRLSGHFASYQDYKEIRVQVEGDAKKIVLMHYPILSWHGVGKGSWHLHGHCHANLPEDPNMARMDVGVDTHQFRPWHLDEIIEHLRGRHGTPADHHGPRDYDL